MPIEYSKIPTAGDAPTSITGTVSATVNSSYTYIHNPTVRNVTTAGVVVGPLAPGKYFLKTKGENIYYKQGSSSLATGDVATDETTPSTSNPLDFYDGRVPINVSGSNDNYIALKLATGGTNALVWIIYHSA